MKNLIRPPKGKLLLFLVGALAATLVFAFKNDPKIEKKPFAKVWFTYNGSGGPGTNSNYSLAGGTGADPGCPTSPTTVCSVYADPSSGNSNYPDQTELNTISSSSSAFTTSAANLEYHSR